MDTIVEGAGVRIERVAWNHIDYHLKNRYSVTICYLTQEAQTTAL